VTQLVECGPMLVDAGKAFAHPGRDSAARRTFLATDGQNQWCMGVASGCTMTRLAQALLDPQLVPGMKVAFAMNLDGGPSSSLAWRTPNGAFDEKFSGARVRNAILLLPK
jgi:hypothetical protein